MLQTSSLFVSLKTEPAYPLDFWQCFGSSSADSEPSIEHCQNWEIQQTLFKTISLWIELNEDFSVFLDALERLVLALCLGLLLLARPRHLRQVGVDLGLVGGLLLGSLLQGIGRSKLLNVDGKLCHEAQKR